MPERRDVFINDVWQLTKDKGYNLSRDEVAGNIIDVLKSKDIDRISNFISDLSTIDKVRDSGAGFNDIYENVMDIMVGQNDTDNILTPTLEERQTENKLKLGELVGAGLLQVAGGTVKMPTTLSDLVVNAALNPTKLYEGFLKLGAINKGLLSGEPIDTSEADSLLNIYNSTEASDLRKRLSAVSNSLGPMGMVVGGLPNLLNILDKAGNKIIDAGSKLNKIAQRFGNKGLFQIAEDDGIEEAGKYFLAQMVVQAPQLAEVMAIGFLTSNPHIATVLISGQAMGGKQRQLELSKPEIPELKQNLNSFLTGVVEYATESAGTEQYIGRILRDKPLKDGFLNGIKYALYEGLKAAPAEGLEELVAGAGEDIVDVFTGISDVAPKDLGKMLMKNFPRYAEEGLLGAAAGFAMGGGMATMQAATNDVRIENKLKDGVNVNVTRDEETGQFNVDISDKDNNIIHSEPYPTPEKAHKVANALTSEIADIRLASKGAITKDEDIEQVKKVGNEAWSAENRRIATEYLAKYTPKVAPEDVFGTPPDVEQLPIEFLDMEAADAFLGTKVPYEPSDEDIINSAMSFGVPGDLSSFNVDADVIANEVENMSDISDEQIIESDAQAKAEAAAIKQFGGKKTTVTLPEAKTVTSELGKPPISLVKPLSEIPKGKVKIEPEKPLTKPSEPLKGIQAIPSRVQTQKRIYRQNLKDNPDTIYLFGDNLQKVGMGGQAKEMRGESNAIGIPTKKSPSMDASAFFTDAEYSQNVKAIDDAFAKIPKGKNVIIPEDGLGTGLAQLDIKAPKTFAYLQSKIKEIGKVQTQLVTTKVKKIVSGGQTGADSGALEAGRLLGIETGGVAPLGFQTEHGGEKTRLTKSGLTEFNEKDLSVEEKKYLDAKKSVWVKPWQQTWNPRTYLNINRSDGTVIFGDIKSPGSILTANIANEIGKPLITNPTVAQLTKWLNDNNIETLNVAGNRKSKDAGLGIKVINVLKESLGVTQPKIEIGTKIKIDIEQQYSTKQYNEAIGTAKTYLSNFEQLKIPIKDEYGNEYWNSEGYYMAQRTNNLEDKKKIAITSKLGGQASRNARRKFTLDQNIDNRLQYMINAVRAKFQNNPDLTKQLISTGNKEIIEKNYWSDTLFGVSNKTLKGANILGKVLMQVRNELKSATQPVAKVTPAQKPLAVQPTTQVPETKMVQTSTLNQPVKISQETGEIYNANNSDYLRIIELNNEKYIVPRDDRLTFNHIQNTLNMLVKAGYKTVQPEDNVDIQANTIEIYPSKVEEKNGIYKVIDRGKGYGGQIFVGPKITDNPNIIYKSLIEEVALSTPTQAKPITSGIDDIVGGEPGTMFQEKEPADVVYIGEQDTGYGDTISLYNITKEGHERYGSTVTGRTVKELGLQIPEEISTKRISDIKNVFKQTKELSQIGTEEQYSQYLDTIFPNSKTKNILYHYSESTNKFDKFDMSYIGSGSLRSNDPNQGISFVTSKELAIAYGMYNIDIYQLPKEILLDISERDKVNLEKHIITAIVDYKKTDGDYALSIGDDEIEVMIKNPERIHILGSSQDIIKFKEFTKKQPTQVKKRQLISQNLEAADKIAKRVVKRFPNLKIENVKGLIVEHGIEAFGKAVQGTIHISDQGYLDTIGHEAFEEWWPVWFGIVENMDVGRLALKNFGGEEKSYNKKKEAFADFAGEYFAGKVQNETLLNKFKAWLKQFLLTIKKIFSKLTAKEAAQYVTRQFYTGKLGSKVGVVTLDSEVKYQLIEEPDAVTDINKEETDYENGEKSIADGMSQVGNYFSNMVGGYISKRQHVDMIGLVELDRGNLNEFIKDLKKYWDVEYPKNKFNLDDVKYTNMASSFFQRTSSKIPVATKKDEPGRVMLDMVFDAVPGNDYLFKIPDDGKLFSIRGKTDLKTSRKFPERESTNFIEDRGNTSFFYLRDKQIVKKVSARDGSTYYFPVNFSFDANWYWQIMHLLHDSYTTKASENLLYLAAAVGGDNSGIWVGGTNAEVLNMSQEDVIAEFKRLHNPGKGIEPYITKWHLDNYLADIEKYSKRMPNIHKILLGQFKQFQKAIGAHWLIEVKNVQDLFNRLRISASEGPRWDKETTLMVVDAKTTWARVRSKDGTLSKPQLMDDFDGSTWFGTKALREMESDFGLVPETKGGSHLLAAKTSVEYLSKDLEHYIGFKHADFAPRHGMELYRNEKDTKPFARTVVDKNGLTYFVDAKGNEFDRLADTNGVKRTQGNYKKQYEILRLPKGSTKLLIAPTERTKSSSASPFAFFEQIYSPSIDSKLYKEFNDAVKEFITDLAEEYILPLIKAEDDPSILRDMIYSKPEDGQLPTTLQSIVDINMSGTALSLPEFMNQVLPQLNSQVIVDGLYKGRQRGRDKAAYLNLKPAVGFELEKNEFVVGKENTSELLRGIVNDLFVFRQPIAKYSAVDMYNKLDMELEDYGANTISFHRDVVKKILEGDWDWDSVSVERLTTGIENAIKKLKETDVYNRRNKTVNIEQFESDIENLTPSKLEDIAKTIANNTTSAGSQGVFVNAKSIASKLLYKDAEIIINGKKYRVRDMEEVVTMKHRISKKYLNANPDIFKEQNEEGSRYVDKNGKKLLTLEELSKEDTIYFKTTFENSLNTYLQMSVDNPSQGHLGTIGYDGQMFVIERMFYNVDKPDAFHDRSDIKVLQSVFSFFNYSDVRRGEINGQNITYEDAFYLSNELNNLLKLNAKEQGNSITYQIQSVNDRNAKSLTGVTVNGNISATEHLLITPAKVVERMRLKEEEELKTIIDIRKPTDEQKKRKMELIVKRVLFGDGAPLVVRNKDILKIVHYNTISKMSNLYSKQKDKYKDNPKYNDAVKFGDRISKEFSVLLDSIYAGKDLEAIDKIKINADYNEEIIKFVDKNIEQFNRLNDTEQFISTMQFLTGRFNKQGYGAQLKLLPVSLMHGKTLDKYADLRYNELMSGSFLEITDTEIKIKNPDGYNYRELSADINNLFSKIQELC